MDAGAKRRPRTGDSRAGAVDVERSDIPTNVACAGTQLKHILINGKCLAAKQLANHLDK